VKHVFLLTGGGAMHLNDALARCSDLPSSATITNKPAPSPRKLFEATNNLGVAMLRPVPAARMQSRRRRRAWLIRLDARSFRTVNAPTACSVRWHSARSATRGSQEVDIVSIIKPITKYAVTIDDPQSIRYISKKRYTWLSLEDRPVLDRHSH